jgi:hypothetical protein
MKLNDAIEKPMLNERTLMQMARDWAGFKTQYTNTLKTKGQAAANQYAAQWVGPMEGYKGIDSLKNELAKQGVQVDKADEILFKVVDASHQEKTGGETQQKEKGEEFKAKLQANKGKQHEIEQKRILQPTQPVPLNKQANKPSGAPNQD